MFLCRNTDDRVSVKTIPFNETFHLLFVVMAVYAESLADGVLEIRAREIEFDVEDISVVGERGKSFILLNSYDPVFDGKFRTKHVLEFVGFFKDDLLGCGMPCTEFGFWFHKFEFVGIWTVCVASRDGW